MNAEQSIMLHILQQHWDTVGQPDDIAEYCLHVGDEVEVVFADHRDELQDLIYEFRCGGYPTGLPTPSSRHYECDAMGVQLSNGRWVGWDYWYGGGKHGEPEAMSWMDMAYFLDVTEEEKLVIVRTFKKAEK